LAKVVICFFNLFCDLIVYLKVIGRGIDLASLVKDVYLLDWLNINCIRTSHYPYAEEFYQFADQMGIAVIDEVPAVGFKYAQNFNKITNSLHKQLLSEMYNRDKNHPSVVMWSLANEASVDLDPSVPYFM
jgi:beta-glucuronidase